MISAGNGRDHPAADPLPSAQSPTTLLVGRDRELATLRAACSSALEGRGRLILISGEAGIGKTALVRQVVDELSKGDALVLTGACYDLTTTPPYGPWLDLLRSYRQPGSLQMATAFALNPTSFTGMPGQDGPIDELLTFLSELTARQPLVVVLEDLHWSDQASIDLLRVAARRVQNDRIALIVTWRDDEVAIDHPLYLMFPSLVRESQAERVELRPLDEGQVRALVPQYYQLQKAELDELIEFLEDRAEGNPLFIHETLRHLELQGILRHQGGRWSLRGLGQATVPVLIRQMVAGRLAHVSQSSARAVQTAAVIGQQVPIQFWETCLDEGTPGLALEEVDRTGLLEVRSAAQTISFRHALLRQAVHESIPLPLRRRLHQRVAATYLRQLAPDPESVAYHLQQAGDPRAVDWLVDAGERAERRFAWYEAIARYGEAIEIISPDPGKQARLAGLLLRVGELLRFADPARANEHLQNAHATAIASNQEEIAAHALFGIGQNLCNLGDPRQGLKLMQDAISTMERRTPGEAASSSQPLSVIDPAHVHRETWFRGNYGYWLVAFGRARGAAAIAEANLGVDWRKAGDNRSLARIATESMAGNRNTYLTLGHSRALLGDPDESGLAFNLSLEVNREFDFEPHNLLIANNLLLGHHFPYRAHKPDERASLVEDINKWLQTFEGMVADPYLPGYELLLLLEGRWDELQGLSASNPDPTLFPYWSIAMTIRASLARFRGDSAHARSLLDRLLPDGPRTRPEEHIHLLPGAPHRVATCLALDARDYDLARAWLAAHDRWLEWSSAVPGRADGTLLRAMLHHGEGNIQAAVELATKALHQARNPEQPLTLIVVHRFLGELSTVSEDFDGAESSLSASLDLADACRAPFERALTLLALAEVKLAQDERTIARQLLDEVRETCTAVGARPTLERAQQLAKTLSANRTDDTYGLSPREREVLVLIVQGMTDRRIAEKLFISHRTVMRHVSHILRKLEVDSRTAAAAKVVGERLL